MVAWFIIAIATLAVFAFIAVNGVQTVAATTDSVSRVEISRRMDTAVNALLARSASPNNTGVAYLPAPATVNGVNTLPTDLAAVAFTPFGQSMVYCPFGGTESGTAATVTSADGSSYGVQTAAVTFNGVTRNFVVGGRPPYPQVSANPNLLGYLIAPRTKLSPTPSCDQVLYNTNTLQFEAPDAIVRSIVRDAGSSEVRNQAAREVVFYVSQTGTGSGLSTGDPTSFATALSYYRTRQPASMRIVLADGSYVFPQSYLDIRSGTWTDKGTNGTLTIQSATGNAYIAQSASGWIDIPGNLNLLNVVFDSGTLIDVDLNHSGNFVNIQSGSIFVTNGGQLYLNGGTITDTQNWPILVQMNARATIIGNVTLRSGGYQGVGSVGGSNVSIYNANLTVVSTRSGGYQDRALYIDPTSTMVVTNAAVNLASPSQDAMAMNYGKLTVNGATTFVFSSSANAGIDMMPGSSTEFDTGSIAATGGKPNYGVVDYGANSFMGSGSTFYSAVRCWADSGSSGLFMLSAAGQTNNTSNVTADETPATMSSPPTNAQVTAYTASIANNTQRQILRTVNTSSVTCKASS